MGKRKLFTKRSISACIFLILVLAMIYGGLRIAESTVLFGNQTPTGTKTSKTITVNGVDYYPRQDITVLLLIGIDKYGPAESSGYYRNDGDADMVTLLIMDDSEKTFSILTLNRDTMVEMPVLGFGGQEAGKAYAQLTLAHTYGSGLEDSCENVKKTVSQFLLGADIDYYVSFRMDAVSIINDGVGGVTVNVTEDFSDIDPTITMGQITLKGTQAINYLRTRKDVGDQLNISRLERHKGYMTAFVEAFRQTEQQDPEKILEAYDALKPYLVTDCPTAALSTLMEHLADYTFKTIYTPEGENILAEQYYEFHADVESVTALALELFYIQKR